MSLIIYKFFILLILKNLIFNVYGGDDACNKLEDKFPSLKLKRHLFCDYDPSVRPVDEHKNRTKVNVFMIPKLATFSDYSSILDMHTWMYIAWKDVNLKWNPMDFIYIDNLWVKSSEIWTPDITVQNSESSSDASIPYTNCIVTKGGEVVCVPAIVYSSRCNTNYRYWPFDELSCSFEFSSWAHGEHEISLQEETFTVVMDHYSPNSEWRIIGINLTQQTRKSRYMNYGEIPTVIVEFQLQRGDNFLWRVFVTPTILLGTMTLTTLWLDPASSERLIIALINFLCHFKCIENVHWILPQSEGFPNILMFYHNSLILATVALILTCLLRKMMELETSPPEWISTYVSIILTSKLGQILSLSILDPKASARIEEDVEDNSDLVGSETSTKSKWNHVITVIGWIAFIVSFLLYLIFLIIFLHVPRSEKSFKPFVTMRF